MEEQVKPVQRLFQLSFVEHLELLPEVGRIEGRKPQGEAQNDDQAPGLFRDPQQNLFHILYVAPESGEVNWGVVIRQEAGAKPCFSPVRHA